MSMYNKLFTKILDSSIWLEDDQTRIVWMTMLAAMDEDGFCQFASPGNVANRARVPREAAVQALAKLEAPDPESSDPENDGRRLERVPGGWIVLNSKKYRDLVTREVIKAQTRQRVQKHREKKRTCNGDETQAEAVVVADSASHSSAAAEEAAAASHRNVTDEQRDAAKPRHAPGPLAGSLPRDHIEHVWCGARFCLTTKMRDRLVRGYGGDPRAAEDAISAWVQAFHDGMGDSAYGGPQWLLQHFDAHLVAIGRVKPAPKAHAKPLTFRERLEAGKR